MENQQHNENNFDDMEITKLNLDTLHLTDVSRFLPDLVWEQVVNKLYAPNDIESCSNSSLYFRTLLYKKRESQAVPKVVHLLLDYLILDESDESNDIQHGIRDLDIQEVGNIANHAIENVDQGADQDQHEMKDNSLREIWNCRLVSKSMNSAIEGLFPHKDAGHYILKFDMGSFKYLEQESYANDIFAPSIPPQVFMVHFDPTHYNFVENKPIKNPFLGRSVRFMEVQIHHQQDMEYVLYLEGILELLGKYGEEIWYVHFDFQNSVYDNSHVELYECFQSFLTLLPNLKILRVSYQVTLPPTQDLLEQDFMRNHLFGVLEEAVHLNSIPTIPKLEMMSLSNLPTPIFNELIVRNRHISQLQLDRKAYHGDYGLFWIPFYNLIALNMKIGSVDQFETFENWQFPMPLEKVYLWYDDSVPFISWSRMFSALEGKFGNSCKELLIQMPLPKTEEERKQVLEESHACRLNLKMLEKVTVFDDTPFCLDFLLHSKNTLANIRLMYSNDHDKNAVVQHLKNQKLVDCRQFIEFVGFKEKMEESNIWNEFPSLVDIKLQRNFAMGGCITYKASSTENRGTHGLWVKKEHWYSATGGILD